MKNPKLEDNFIQMINKYNYLETIDFDFVSGIKVSHGDVHLLDIMFNNPYKKASELAELFGVTKGAASQQIKKMEKRGLLNRIRHNDNYKEVFIELTNSGLKAIENHNIFQEIVLGEFRGLLTDTTVKNREFLFLVLEKLIKGFNAAEIHLKHQQDNI